MLVLAWILAVLGAGGAWVILLGSAMSTVPRLSLAAAGAACVLPALAILLAVGEGSWIATLLPAATIVVVGSSWLGQPDMRGVWKRLGPTRTRSRQNNARAEAGPWSVHAKRSRFGKVRIDVSKEGRRTGRIVVDDASGGADLWNHHLVVDGDVGALALGTTLRAFSLDPPRLVWTHGLAVGEVTPAAVEGAIVGVGLLGMSSFARDGSAFWHISVKDAERVQLTGSEAAFRLTDGSERRFLLTTGEPAP